LIAVSRGPRWPRLCPDPVFGLNDALALQDVSPRVTQLCKESYLLLTLDKSASSFLGDQWIRQFVENAGRDGLTVYNVPVPEGSEELPVDANIALPLCPLDWYSLIRRSAGLLGTRFHPIVCCVANGVPFMSIDNNVKHVLRVPVRLMSKQYDLCRSAGLSSNCLALGAIKALGPHTVYSMLRSCDRQRMAAYGSHARTRLHATIRDILARP